MTQIKLLATHCNFVEISAFTKIFDLRLNSQLKKHSTKFRIGISLLKDNPGLTLPAPCILESCSKILTYIFIFALLCGASKSFMKAFVCLWGLELVWENPSITNILTTSGQQIFKPPSFFKPPIL